MCYLNLLQDAPRKAKNVKLIVIMKATPARDGSFQMSKNIAEQVDKNINIEYIILLFLYIYFN